MTHNLAPFAAVGALINQGVSQLLSNATATWQGGGQAFGVIFQKGTDDGFVDGVVTTVRHTVSMCVANAPGTGTVTVLHADGTAEITQDGGAGLLRARNPLLLASGTRVYVQGAAITGPAPDLPYVLIEV